MILRLTPALLLVLIAVVSTHADDIKPDAPDKKPGQHVIDRANADRALLFPQTGLGGDPNGNLPYPKDTEAEFSEFKVDSEGNGGMIAYKFVPKNLVPGRKYPLMFTWHGNGESGNGNVHNLAPLTLGIDACIVCGMQYQKLEDNGAAKFNNPMLADMEKTFKAARWLLAKMEKDYPIDSERIFVGGFSMGTGYSSGWATWEWQQDPETYPFRAVILFSSQGSTQRASLPPTPVICTVGSDETAVLGIVNVTQNVRQYCNLLIAWGHDCQYHEIPKMGHAVNMRCICIARDTINLLGGPGLQWSTPGSSSGPEPLPFKSEDPLVKQVIALCAADDWVGARNKLAEIAKDSKVKIKDKKPAHDFEREMEKFAKDEVPRLMKEVDKSVKAEKLPQANQVKRLKSLAEAYKDALWLKNTKDVLAGVQKAESPDFPPAARETERKKMMQDALDLEKTEGKRPDAKKLYVQLAARKGEDGGTSSWPGAAEYRLTWWVED